MEVKKWRQSRLQNFATCEISQVSQVAKFRNLQNSASCENSQPCKISAVCHFSSICGSNFLPTSVASFEFGMDSSCLD